MLRERVITALVLLALLLPALFAPIAWPFAALSLLAVAAAGWEWARLNGLRSGLAQITGTGALAALLPLAMLQLGRSPTAAEGRVIAALFFTGAVIGLFYWLIAGRKAGRKPAVSAPVSPGS